MDFQKNFLSSLGAGYEIGSKIKERQDSNRLNQLAQVAYSAPAEQQQAAIGQAMGIDRAAGSELEKQVATTEERRNSTMVNMAKLLTSAPEQARPALWQRFVPTLSQFGLSELPTEYNAQTAPVIDQAAKSLVQAYAGNGTVQSQKIGEDGYIYNTFRDGRIVNTGVKADRQAWFRDQPGFEPEIINKDGTVRALGASGGAMASSPVGQGVSVGSGTGAVQMNIEGIPAVQQQRMAQTVSLMRQAGYPENEIDAFVAGQLPPDVPGLPQAGSAPTQPMSRARPSAAQEAQATEMARQQVQLAALPARLQLENDAALSRASGESQVKAQAEQAATNRTNSTAAKVYDEGMGGAIRALAGSSTGPIVGRLPALTSDQQIAEGGISAMAPVLKQMFRVAGEGTFTDKDQDLLMAMLPTRKDSPEAREAKAANVDNIVRAKLNMGPPQKATNPKTGETLYLRFGQWVKK